ncbi:hypothetical protein ACFOY2_05030 [Nonomuraea purpurea]|uniref:CdiI immunity protein domain-containing protein n=1 Tax=Nonomuraea purpurea TaxID=1849276 RepID=A0ABV8FY06_9ACTN
MSHAAIEKAIREFPFWDYGMDNVDPESEYAEWVPALALAISDALAADQSGEASR